MDHLKVLKRSFEITWRYRALWVFGILLALTTGGGGGGGGSGWDSRGGRVSPPPSEGFRVPEIPPQVVTALIAVGIGLACVILILIIASIVVRYLAETSLIRMVNDHEETGEKRSVRQGFRWGWSRTALRLFLIDLLIGLPLVVGFILLLLLALTPLLLWTTGSQTAGVIGTVAAVGLVVLFVLLFIVVAVVVSLLTHFFRRACALEEIGVREAIRQGYGLVRRHLKDVAVMWLIMVGLGFAWLIVMIPVVLILVLLGIVLGGMPALLVGGLASLALKGALPWILAGAVGLPIFILVIAIPSLFLGGLWQVFKSSVWTLTYRELRALEAVQLPQPTPASAE